MEGRRLTTDPRGLAALVLAVGSALALIAIAVGASVHRGPISSEESSLISTVLGASVGALATYLGGGGRRPSGPPDGRPPTPSPPTRNAS